jgi:hypothetical protein
VKRSQPRFWELWSQEERESYEALVFNQGDADKWEAKVTDELTSLGMDHGKATNLVGGLVKAVAASLHDEYYLTVGRLQRMLPAHKDLIELLAGAETTNFYLPDGIGSDED